MKKNKTCICGKKKFVKIYSFYKKPISEINFNFIENKKYFRELFKCKVCNHVISIHNMYDKNLYHGDYSKSNYNKNILKTFLKINSLPASKSDNFWRIKNLEKFSKYWFSLQSINKNRIKILDVGSGLCVFLNRIKKKLGWDCTALEIDKSLSKHARLNVGIKTLNMNFLKMQDNKKYNIISFNKVIEHVENPILFIKSAKKKLKKNGFVYVEVPDAEGAAQDKNSYQREEFTIDHPHVFSSTSLCIAIIKSNMKLLKLERVIEPSGKYTLRAFAVKNSQID